MTEICARSSSAIAHPITHITPAPERECVHIPPTADQLTGRSESLDLPEARSFPSDADY